MTVIDSSIDHEVMLCVILEQSSIVTNGYWWLRKSQFGLRKLPTQYPHGLCMSDSGRSGNFVIFLDE